MALLEAVMISPPWSVLQPRYAVGRPSVVAALEPSIMVAPQPWVSNKLSPTRATGWPSTVEGELEIMGVTPWHRDSYHCLGSRTACAHDLIVKHPRYLMAH